MSSPKNGKRRIAALIALAAGAPLSGTAGTSAQLGGYRIQFKTQSQERSTKAAELMPQSVIEITRAGSGAPIYKEQSLLEPGCGKVPAAALVTDQYVALCGHLGGRHYTHRVFRIGSAGPESATLDAFDDPAPMKADARGVLTALVARRDQFPGELVGPLYFPYVYALRADDSTFGFVPTFGLGVKQQYLDYYSGIRASQDLSQFLPVLLAALIATQDPELICQEVQQWRRDQLEAKGNTNAFDSAIRHWVAKLPVVGYPAFDLTRC